MLKPIKDVSELRENLLKSYAGLQEQTALDSYEVTRWLLQNINRCNTILLGHPGRPLRSYDGANNVLKEIRGMPVLDIKNEWIYIPNSRVAAPDFQAIACFLGGLKIKNPEASAKTRVELKIRLDLQQWPSLVRHYLADSIYCLNTGRYQNDKKKDVLCRNRDILLKHFYPDLTLELLDMASDLGLLDNRQAFASWLETREHGSNEKTGSLPNSFEL